MDFLRPMTVQTALAAATALCVAAGFGAACQAQDERGAVSQAGYGGPYLTWAGKQPAAAPPSELTEARYAPAPDYAPSRYVPQSPRSEPPLAPVSAAPVSEPPPARYTSATYAPQPQSAPPVRYATYAPRPQPAPPPVVPAAAAPPTDAAEDGAPDLFPPPEPAPAQAAPAPTHALAPPPAANYAQPAAAPAPAQQAQAQGPAQGSTGVRLYSLHRAYGMSPDPIPEPTEGHTVLIAAPDHAAAADRDQDSDQDQDDGGRHAAHGDDAGDGQSGDN
jgi:hypothetical protein